MLPEIEPQVRESDAPEVRILENQAPEVDQSQTAPQIYIAEGLHVSGPDLPCPKPHRGRGKSFPRPPDLIFLLFEDRWMSYYNLFQYSFSSACLEFASVGEVRSQDR